MQKRWVLRTPNLELANQIAKSHRLSPVLSQILLNRNLSSTKEITEFLQPSLANLPDPSLMKNMDRAVTRLVQAVRHHEKIVIYGDYDVDGTTSTVLLMNFFQAVGADIDFYIPHRLREGYSLNAAAVEKIAKDGCRVLITVDNGISAVAEAEKLKNLGVDLIITDHHEVPPQLPPALAILNPKQGDDPFPGKELAGVGVAYYLLIALRRSMREEGLLSDREPNLRQALDLVAVGTIADLAPLRGINRILVREGLKVINQNPRPGLKALLEVSGVGGEVRSDQIAFQVGPRINAVGRLEEASLGVRLLLEEDEKICRDLAERLDAANVARRELEDQIVQESVAMIKEKSLREKYQSLVIYQSHWHPGVVGIVASRLVERYYRPTIVLTQDENGIKGSARSVSGFNIVAALRRCEDLLDRFGGHAYAAGLSLRPEKLDAFIDRFDKIVQEEMQPEDFTPAIKMDAESPIDALNREFMEQLKKLEPFGLGNPAPLFLLKGATVRESRIVGENHLKMRVGQGGRTLGAIGFRLAAKQPEAHSQVDLAFIPEWNEWNGSKNIQLRFIDLKPRSS